MLAQDTTAVLPAIKAANDAGIPVIAYDRLIEDPTVLYITFDNVLVGKDEAAAILAKVPPGTTDKPELRPDQGRPGRPECLDLPAHRAGMTPVSRPPSMPARSSS